MSEPTRVDAPDAAEPPGDVLPASVGESPASAHSGERPLANDDFLSDPMASSSLLSEQLPLSRPEQLVGLTVGERYKVEAVIGEGGMGVVYRCRHRLIDRRFAMKVLRADLARDDEVTVRFLQEARAASAIGHEHIIDIHDFGHLPDGSTFFVMDYLEGRSLGEELTPGATFTEARALRVARQIAEGLSAAHEAGIVHRDLKPDNVFLTTRGGEPDFVKILDFGIAKVSSSPTAQLTRAGAVFGTPHYMSPEQSSGAPVDHRGDIYALGVMLYELVSGSVPFDADNFMGILTQHMYKAPVPLRALVPAPDVSPGFEAVVLKCLAKRPEDRYQTMSALIEDLDALAEGRAPSAEADAARRSSGIRVPTGFLTGARLGTAAPGAAPRARKRWPLLAAGGGVVAGVAVTALTFARNPHPPPPVAVAPKAATAVAPALPAAPVVERPAAVAIAVEPIDAEVFRGDENLGTSPVVVEVPRGSTVTIEVRREGYAPQSFVLDGKAPKLGVRLEKDRAKILAAKPRSSAVPPAPLTPARVTSSVAGATQPRPTPPQASPGIVNPWGN